MTELSRSLSVLADGAPLEDFNHAALSGSDSLNLFPFPYTLKLWNLSDENYLRLSRAKEVTVFHDDIVLASGTLSDVFRRITREGAVTTAVFSLGLPLWEALVSLSVEAGVKASETVRRILAASGTGIQLLGWAGDDPTFTRGQAFCGRASECVALVLSAADARGYLVPSGLCVVPKEGLPVSQHLTEEDLIEAPAFPSGGLMVLRTRPAGWSVGKTISVTWGGETTKGLIIERSVSADSLSGPWQTELLAQIML